MLIKWIKKKVLKSIIDDLIEQLPNVKVTILNYLEAHKNELLEFCKKKLKEAIVEFIKSRCN